MRIMASTGTRSPHFDAAQAPWRPALRAAVLVFAASLLLGGCDTGESGDGIDPGIVEIPIAFIKRPIPIDEDGDEVNADLREPRLFSSGGDVYLRTSSTTRAEVENLSLPVTGGRGDVKGLNSNHEGTKLIFSLRLFDPDPNDDIVPTWNIYEYDLENSQLRRIISSDLIAEEGDDLYPSYLPDGRILFTSNRQRQAREMLINEGRPRYSALDEDENEPAIVLHVMNGDGTDIRQISFNQSHDLFPQVLTHFKGGKIVFSRWDNAVGNNEFNLYTANPDGSGMEILYGSRSHQTGTNGATIQFTSYREMENGELMVITGPFTGNHRHQPLRRQPQADLVAALSDELGAARCDGHGSCQRRLDLGERALQLGFPAVGRQ